jgi:hypothetical protein
MIVVPPPPQYNGTLTVVRVKDSNQRKCRTCYSFAFVFGTQKLALTSPTSGGRSVGVVRSRTQATEFLLSCI